MTERWKPSVTVAAVIERGGRYLLVEEETSEGLRLNTPAGHLEPGETLVQAVAREALEETAWLFRPEALVGIYLARLSPGHGNGDGPTYLRFAFSGALAGQEDGRALDAGIVRTLWMSWDELCASAERHRSPLVLQCVADHRAGLRYPLELLRHHPSVHGAD